MAPSTQDPVRESAGRAQLVKSARICESALLPGLEQRELSAAMSASLDACSAWKSRQTTHPPHRAWGRTYTGVCTDGFCLGRGQATRGLGVLNYGITYYGGGVSSIEVGGVGEGDAAAAEEDLIPAEVDWVSQAFASAFDVGLLFLHVGRA